jgi:hypothetical protein
MPAKTAPQPRCAADTAGAVRDLGRFHRQARGRLLRSGGSVQFSSAFRSPQFPVSPLPWRRLARCLSLFVLR